MGIINNTDITVYHKVFDKKTRLEKWVRHNYTKCWYFGGKGAGLSRGYENANDCEIRIWYAYNSNLNFDDFECGDIIVPQALKFNISRQQDLDGYNIFNITSKVDNKYGTRPHVHLSGK